MALGMAMSVGQSVQNEISHQFSDGFMHIHGPQRTDLNNLDNPRLPS